MKTQGKLKHMTRSIRMVLSSPTKEGMLRSQDGVEKLVGYFGEEKTFDLLSCLGSKYIRLEQLVEALAGEHERHI